VSQHTQGVVHLQALEQIAQGNFGGLGPEFGSGAYDSASSNEHRYSKYISLYFFTQSVSFLKQMYQMNTLPHILITWASFSSNSQTLEGKSIPDHHAFMSC